MLSIEADWLSAYFSAKSNQTLGTVLNVGSSTSDFRCRIQPFIEERVFSPLKRRGVQVIHSDIKAGDGVTIVADIATDKGLKRLQAVQAKTIVCSNVLEHVPSALDMAKRLAELVPSGGILLVTVPRSYPYHPDPIDTLFRPNIVELHHLFTEFEIEEGAILEGPSLLTEFRHRPLLFPRRIIRSCMPLPNFGGWLSTIHRWCWLLKPYKVTCVALRKPAAS